MRKLLIFIPSPRDLLQFHEAIAKIPHDKIWYKYMPYELQPYQQASVVGDDFDLMNEQIDHAYGHLIRRPCLGGFANLHWDGEKLFDNFGQLRSKRLK